MQNFPRKSVITMNGLDFSSFFERQVIGPFGVQSAIGTISQSYLKLTKLVIKCNNVELAFARGLSFLVSTEFRS